MATKVKPMGATKENAISVETYRNSMQPRNHKKRFFIDLNRATQETHYEDVHVLDSFPFPNRNHRRKITLNSTFEAGESSKLKPVLSLCVKYASMRRVLTRPFRSTGALIRIVLVVSLRTLQASSKTTLLKSSALFRAAGDC